MTGLMIAVSALATLSWRFLGVMFSREMSDRSEAYHLFSCFTYALMAALVVQMTLDPQSRLAETEPWERIAALLATLTAYLLTRHGIVAGTFAGLAVFAGLVYR